MDASQTVIEEANRLSSRHSEVGVRIDVIKRQRYNAWALTKIEETINAVNSITSSSTGTDNVKTIEVTVNTLGQIDPLLLEPFVSQLYNYALEQAKSNINSGQRIELGKRLIDTKHIRKSYGDF